MRALLAVTLLLALPSRCDPSGAETPVQAYIAFDRAIRRGELDRAYAALSSDTRALIKKQAEELSAASDGAIKNDPVALFFGAAPRGPELTEVKLMEIKGDRAMVSARAGEHSRTVKLTKEADGWKVDLTEALRP